MRPKEIQARIRSGETAEQIADTGSVPIERVRWFEGPVLAERAYIAQQAQAASVRLPGDPRPGPRLGEIVTERLRDLGADPEEAQWDSRKRGDGSWLVELTSGTGAERLIAAWVFDSRRRHAMPEDDEAARLSLPVDALEAAGLMARPDPAARGRGTVTPFVPRSNPTVPRPAVAPDSEPASEPVSEAASEPADAADRDIEAEVAAQGLRAARLPDAQPSPSGVPQLPPPAHGTRRPQAAERAEPLAPGRAAPHTPERAAPHAPAPRRPGCQPRVRSGRRRRSIHQPPWRASRRSLTRTLRRPKPHRSRRFVTAPRGRHLVAAAAARRSRPGTRSCLGARAARTDEPPRSHRPTPSGRPCPAPWDH